ncbi:hypothetical protein Q1695_009783 [Nippostrongylus brasiliensis]|nr:hypothetical protein Q1695_009783 [Nippostrongylus brasiliensis]
MSRPLSSAASVVIGAPSITNVDGGPELALRSFVDDFGGTHGGQVPVVIDPVRILQRSAKLLHRPLELLEQIILVLVGDRDARRFFQIEFECDGFRLRG